MEYVVIGALFLVAGALVLAALERQNLLEGFQVERDKWAEERRELLTRIQHPERVPTKTQSVSTPPSTSPQTRKALASVGTVAPQVSDGD